MNFQEEWPKLFTKASFFYLKKEEALSSELVILQSKFQFNENISTFHPNRKNEFILGRICASKAYEKCTGIELLELESGKDRAPIWPSKVVGSISHNKNFVGAAVAKKNELIGIGIDFEEIDRAKIELSSHIKNSEDLKSHPDFSDTELLTVIFSAKESLYKALYPSVQKFFGFEDAALRSINPQKGTFEIELLNDLNPHFGSSTRKSFQGRYLALNKNCLTVIEVFPS